MLSERKIRKFWKWFHKHAFEIGNLLDAGKSDALAEAFRPRIDRLHPELDWEVGPGKSKTYMLTISSKSNRKLRQETERIVANAPQDLDWEFYASIQPRAPHRGVIVRHQGRNLEVETESWGFLSEEDPERGKIHIVIVDEDLPLLPREAALHAVFIMLDALLGEDIVEQWIGTIEIGKPDDSYETLRPIQELPGYVMDARSRLAQ